MTALLLAALLAQAGPAASTWNEPTVPVSAAEARRLVSACGLPAASTIRVVDDRELEEPIVQVVGPVREGAFACIADASLASSYYVQFADAATQGRYEAVYRNHDAAGKMHARAALQRHGLLERLPSFDPPTQTLTDYARKLEELCSVEPGSLLMLASPGMLTIRADALKAHLRRHHPTDEQFACTLNAVVGSNLEEHGVSFGFVGNEAGTGSPVP